MSRTFMVAVPVDSLLLFNGFDSFEVCVSCVHHVLISECVVEEYRGGGLMYLYLYRLFRSIYSLWLEFMFVSDIRLWILLSQVF